MADRSLSNFAVRVATAAVLLPITVGAVLLGSPWFLLLVILMVGAGWWEWLGMGRAGQLHPFAIIGGVAAVGVSALAAVAGPWRALALVALLVALGLAALLRSNYDAVLTDVTYTLLGVVWIGWLGGYAIALRDRPDGTAWLLVALAIAWSADTGAYLAGRAFGKHLLCPRVSPKKTVEGLIGGLVAAIVVGAAGAFWFLPLPWWLGAAVGLLGGSAAVVGDLWESLVKRQLGVKDSGTLVKGHGGVLDRIDSVLFAVPTVTACVILIQGG